MHKVKAVVALAQDAPVTVTTINVPDPGKGEALVKVLTCGVCQTDHHYVTGGVGQDFPPQVSLRLSAMTSPTSPPATWSSSTGVPSAANAAHAARASRSTASQPTTQPRR